MKAATPPAEIKDRSFTPEVEEELESICKRYPERKGALLPALRLLEREFGSVDLGGMKLVAAKLGVSPAYVQGVFSFYFHFRRETDGKFVIEVCRTLPCALRGADQLARHAQKKLGIKPGETTEDGLFTLKNAECLAACDKGPVVHVNAYAWELVDETIFDEIVDGIRANPDGFDLEGGRKWPNPWNTAAQPDAVRTKPEGERDHEHAALTHEPQLLKRCFREDFCHYDDYLQEGPGYEGSKKALKMSPAEVTDLVKKSGLRGRGGAGFPCGVKWTFVPPFEKVPGPRYLLVNADESEPGTCKDIRFIEDDPHMILEGSVIAAHAIGANDVFIYIRGEMRLGAERLNAAIKEAYDKGIFGENAVGYGKRLDITVHRGGGAYICGEETGLISSLEGARGNPRLKPPYPAVEGAWGRPTIVNNIETICNLPLLFTKGLDWYTALGTPPIPKEEAPPRGKMGSQGPKVWCVSGHVKRRGVYDVPFGLTIKQLIEDERFCGGIRDGHKLKGVIPGGSSMPVLHADEIDVPLCYDAVMTRKKRPACSWEAEKQAEEDELARKEGREPQQMNCSICSMGSSIGSAGMFVLDDTTCMVNAALNLAKFYAHESCGQCTPCREGAGWLLKILQRIEDGVGTMEDLEAIDRIARQACARTVCVLAEAWAWPIISYAHKFKDEFVEHIKEGRCPKGGRLCAPDKAPSKAKS